MPADTLAKHVCPQCNNVYNSATYFEMHIKSKHELKPDLKCDFCDFKTLSTQKLNTHKKTVHDVSSFKCNLCIFQSRSKGDLTRHTISNHLCNICDFTAEKRQDLLEHHQNIHKLKCGKCEFEVGTRQKLRKHIEKRHEGKQYDCNDCDYTSSNPAGLLVHKNAKHTKH